MRFEDPIKKFSLEREEDLNVEIELVDAKIRETKNALQAKTFGEKTPVNASVIDGKKYPPGKILTLEEAGVSSIEDIEKMHTKGLMQNPAAEIVQLEEDLRRYEKTKADLVARKMENDRVSLENNAFDQSPPKFSYGPIHEKSSGVQNVLNTSENSTPGVIQNSNQSDNNFVRTEIDEEEKFDREVARRAGVASSVENDRTRKETFDTDLHEEEKFEREVAGRENVKAERVQDAAQKQKEEDRSMRLTEAQKALENIREMLAVKKRRGETAMNKIRSLLGLSVGESQYSKDIALLEEEYQKAQKDYNMILSEGVEQLDESQQKKVNEEMRFLSFKESQAMYDAEMKARMETFAGTVGDKIHKMGLWYRNLPKSVKYGMAAAMLGVGVATGGAGFAGAAAGSVAVVRRFFGAAAAGVGVGMALETRVTAKREQEHQSEREKFAAMTLEQQKAILALMDGETMDRYHKMQTSRRRVKLAVIATAAAVLVGGKAVAAATHAFDGEAMTQKVSGAVEKMSQSTAGLSGDAGLGGEAMMAESVKGTVGDNIDKAITPGKVTTEWFNAHTSFDETVADFEKRGFGSTKVFEEFKKMRGKEAFEKFLAEHKNLSQDEAVKRWDASMIRNVNTFEERMITERKLVIAHNLAQKMGIDGDNLNIVNKGGVPVEINGQKVPLELLTEEQKKSIAVSEKFEAMMSGESKVQKGTGQILESIKIDTKPYDTDYGVEKPTPAPIPTPEKADLASTSDVPHSMLTKMNGISIDQNAGTGKLVIEKNSNYTKTLAAFLEKNNERLTDGKMGWDPAKYKSPHEWAMKRAAVLANEYRAAHKGIDLDAVRPGTEITLDLKNLSDIKTDVKFVDGPRIVPDGVKVQMGHAAEKVHETSAHVVRNELSGGQYVQRYAKELARGFGMTENVYQVTKDMPARDFVATIAQEKNPTPFKREFLEYTRKHPELLNQEAGRVLEEYYREVHDVPRMESPTSQFEQRVNPDGVQGPEDAQKIAEKMGTPEFRREMALQTRKIFGSNISNIHGARVQFLAEHRPDIMRKLTAISERTGISYNNDTKVSTYMARVVAKGVRYEDLGVS